MYANHAVIAELQQMHEVYKIFACEHYPCL